jgi:dTDP-4-amino-4,6-dideoxygalactose transaminase
MANEVISLPIYPELDKIKIIEIAKLISTKE